MGPFILLVGIYRDAALFFVLIENLWVNYPDRNLCFWLIQQIEYR